MAWRTAAAPLLLGQLSLIPLRLSGVGAQKKWTLRLEQPQEQLWVKAGRMLTLSCTISGEGPPGPVKWLKGWGSENETIYDQTSSSSPRVTRVGGASNVDFSIQIRDVQPEDAGTYYCVKFMRSGRPAAALQVFQHGQGTLVSVHDTTLVPGVVAAAVVLFFLLFLGLTVALCMYRRKRRGQAGSRSLSRACCAETPSPTSREVLDAETSHLPSQQSSKEDTTIHYADLQPLPAAPWRGGSPGTARSEYASLRVAAK